MTYDAAAVCLQRQRSGGHLCGRFQNSSCRSRSISQLVRCSGVPGSLLSLCLLLFKWTKIVSYAACFNALAACCDWQLKTRARS